MLPVSFVNATRTAHSPNTDEWRVLFPPRNRLEVNCLRGRMGADARALRRTCNRVRVVVDDDDVDVVLLMLALVTLMIVVLFDADDDVDDADGDVDVDEAEGACVADDDVDDDVEVDKI